MLPDLIYKRVNFEVRESLKKISQAFILVLLKVLLHKMDGK